MAEPTAAETFRSFCATQYGVFDPSHLPARQRLEAEDAFMAGVQFGFYSGWAALDEEAMRLDKEIRAFGARIVDRYQEAELPLGQRRS